MMKSLHVHLQYTEEAPHTFDKDLREKLNKSLRELGLKVVSIGDFGSDGKRSNTNLDPYSPEEPLPLPGSEEIDR